MSEEDLLGTIKATYVLDGNPTLGVAIKIIERLRAENKDLRSMDSHAEKTVERLRSQLAEKDKRVEELECAAQSTDITEDLNAYLKDDGVFIITDAQIDAAWAETRIVEGDHYKTVPYILKIIGIVKCPECGGSKRRIDLPDRACKGCHAHGWIRKEQGDE